MKDINIYSPDEAFTHDGDGRLVYICLHFYDIINQTQKRKLQMEYWESTWIPINVRFNSAPKDDSDDIFRFSHKIIDKFLRGTDNCYVINDYSIYFNVHLKFSSIDYSRSHLIIKNQSVKFHRLRPGEDKYVTFQGTSNWYEIFRLASPYQDGCKDYKINGFFDRTDAFESCLSKQNFFGDRKVLWYDSYSESNGSYGYSPRNIFQLQKSCQELTKNPDCEYKFYLNNLERGGLNPHSIYFEKDVDTSFMVTSKPRIDDIDYVTYILGALGSWLGFSFLGCNPVPYIMSMTVDVIKSNDDRFKELEKKVADKNFQITAINQKCLSLKSLIDQQNLVISNIANQKSNI